MVVGAAGLGLQMVILLSFQILKGFVYLQLALIIACFMAGLAIGSGWSFRLESSRRARFSSGSQGVQIILIWIQVFICLFPLGLMLFLFLSQGEFGGLIPSTAMGLIYSGLSLAAGILGGAHFAMAVFVLKDLGSPLSKLGGGLYAIDLAGAAGGVLFVSFLVLPIYGLMNTLLLLSAVSFTSLLTLLQRPL